MRAALNSIYNEEKIRPDQMPFAEAEAAYGYYQ